MNEQMVKGASVPNGDFALGFQPDGVQLLHRHGNAWDELGKAPFNADLRNGLGGFVRKLRAANAPGLSLVIPDAQILYTDLVLPAAKDTEAALKAGLDGRTPYRVDELAYDYTPADAKPGTTVKVAAVWRQTLQEAEDFAIRHGFAPNRFVAAPTEGQFPRAPDFGATELAAEWELASADLGLSDPVAAEPLPEDAAPAAVFSTMTAPVAAEATPATARALATPVMSRVTPHIVAAAAPAPVAASVNLGSIILPGDAPVTEADEPPAAATDPQPAEAAAAVASAAPAPRPAKPLPDRARAFHERATEARKARPAPTVTARPAAAPGRRTGLGGALPLIGVLVLGLGISAALMGREEAEVAVPATDIATTPEAAPATVPDAATPDSTTATAPAATQPGQPPVVATSTNAQTAAPVAEATAPVSQPQPVTAPQTAATAPYGQPVVTPEATAPQAAAAPEGAIAPADSAMAAAITAAYGTALPASETPPPQVEAPAEAAAPNTAAPVVAATRPAAPAPAAAPATAAPKPATARPVRPPARPQNIARSSATQPAPAAAPAVTTRPTAAASRPASRPAASKPAPAARSANPGAPASATLVTSARPKTAPSRSEPARAAPDAQPSVPRSPQPYEQRQRPEPTGIRPPPKPVTQSSVDGAVLHPQTAPRQFALFSVRDQGAMIAHMDQPWLALASADARPLVRTAEARPARRPTRNDASAVDAAVSEAIATESRPASRASTAPAPSGAAVVLNRSARPAHRPGTVSTSTASTASTAGISNATGDAVQSAIADAVASSSAVPGRVALLPLTSSARPAWRRGGGAPSDAAAGASAGTSASTSEGTLAPEPQQSGGQSKADAEAAALAERRNLDDELQRQAEQRVRERAASDARAEAQAKAAAESRARAQAEAEAAAAARRNQTYRPPEVDNEPEVASAESAPASGAVAGSATAKGIDLNATQLIGTVGAGKASRGLIRLRNGRIVTVRLGDKINGGQISSIGNGGLKYMKAGREYSLPILNGR